MAMAVREVTLGGSGTRTSAVTLGGAAALPFRHFEGATGKRPVMAMEVFDVSLAEMAARACARHTASCSRIPRKWRAIASMSWAPR